MKSGTHDAKLLMEIARLSRFCSQIFQMDTQPSTENNNKHLQSDMFVHHLEGEALYNLNILNLNIMNSCFRITCKGYSAFDRTRNKCIEADLLERTIKELQRTHEKYLVESIFSCYIFWRYSIRQKLIENMRKETDVHGKKKDGTGTEDCI